MLSLKESLRLRLGWNDALSYICLNFHPINFNFEIKMSQEIVMQIIKSSKNPIDAVKIMEILKSKGETISEKSFYDSISRIEKDEHIGFEIRTFHKKKWFYSKTPLKKKLKKDTLKTIKRLRHQIGSKPRYSQNQEEHILKLKREAEILKIRYGEFTEIKTNLLVSIASWKDAAKKFNELAPLIEDISVLEIGLK